MIVPKCRCDRMIQPRCGWRECDELAVISVWMSPLSEGGEHFRFMCALHYEPFYKAIYEPIPGLDRSPSADEYWRPSIMEVVRLGCMKLAFEDRKRQAPAEHRAEPHHSWERRLTPAQFSQLQLFRALSRDVRL